MAITSYSTLKTAIADWIDWTEGALALDTFIDLAEARIYRELRLRFMESSLSVTIASGVAALPSDFMEMKVAYLNTSPVQQLEMRPLEWIYATYPQRSSDSRPLYIARSGDNLEFGPYPDSTYSISGVYFARPTALSASNETNWLTTNAPDLLLYGSLAHSAPYVGDDSRVVLWEAAYQDAKRQVVAQETKLRYPDQMSLRTHVG